MEYLDFRFPTPCPCQGKRLLPSARTIKASTIVLSVLWANIIVATGLSASIIDATILWASIIVAIGLCIAQPLQRLWQLRKGQKRLYFS